MTVSHLHTISYFNGYSPGLPGSGGGDPEFSTNFWDCMR